MQLSLQSATRATTLLTVNRKKTIALTKHLFGQRSGLHRNEYIFTSISQSLEETTTLKQLKISKLRARPTGAPIKLFVKNHKGITLPVYVSPRETIKGVKEKITELDGTLVKQQHLIFAGQQLEDGRELAEYNIQPKSTLQLVVRSLGCAHGSETDDRAQYLTVKVQTQRGPVVKVGILSTNPIERVKEMVEAVGGLPAGCQRLVLDQETLRDGTMVEDYDFEGSIVEEVRNRGHYCAACAPAGGKRKRGAK